MDTENNQASVKPEPGQGLKQIDADRLLKQYGYNEVPEKKTNPLARFAIKFWGLTAWMLETIIILSWVLHKYADAYIVFGLLIFNAVLGFTQEQNANNAVEALKKKLQVSVKLLRDGVWKTSAARELVPGDVIRLRIGDFVPADVKITQGQINIDQSALTGESNEVEKKPEEIVYSGSIVTKGEVTAAVTLTGTNTFYGKTIELVKTAKPKSHIDEVVAGVVKWLSLIVGTLLVAVLIASYLKGDNLLQILPLILVLLLGAIPVALTAMFTVSMAIASKELVKQGVLITRLNAPDDAASMDILCVDKTGTLTLNKLTVTTIMPAAGYSENDVAFYGALASQEANHDSIDTAFIQAAKMRNVMDNAFVQEDFIPFDPQTRKTEATIKKGTTTFKVAKGSFTVIVQLCGIEEKDAAGWEANINEFAKKGFRTLAIAKTDLNEKPRFVGLVALHDPPREDSKKLINELRDLGVTVKMLTGDALAIAVETAGATGIGNNIIQSSQLKKTAPENLASLIEQSNGFAEVYPKDKYDIVKALQAKGHIVGMTGDGVNDAPALKQAEVGIAVSNATDVAKGAASIVLTEEGLSNILSPVRVGRMMFERINTWVLNKIAGSILKTCFVVFPFFILGKYAISTSAMLVLLFMNDFIILSLATDNVKASAKPSKWNINGLAKIAIAIGLLMALEAFALLYAGLHYLGLSTDNNALSTFCFEILLFFALFSIFVVREKGHFWKLAPSKTLVLIIVADLVAGIIIATFGLLGFKEIPFVQTIIVLVYTAICSFGINDLIKFVLYKKWPLDII